MYLLALLYPEAQGLSRGISACDQRNLLLVKITQFPGKFAAGRFACHPHSVPEGIGRNGWHSPADAGCAHPFLQRMGMRRPPAYGVQDAPLILQFAGNFPGLDVGFRQGTRRRSSSGPSFMDAHKRNKAARPSSISIRWAKQSFPASAGSKGPICQAVRGTDCRS